MDIKQSINSVEKCIEEKKYAEAEAILKEIIKEYPNDGAILYNSGVVATGLNQLEEAEKFFVDAIDKEYKVYQSIISLAMIEGVKGNQNAVIELLRKAIELENEVFIASGLLFEEYMEMNQFDKAEQVALDIINKKNDIYLGHHNYVLVLVRKEDVLSAKKHMVEIEDIFKENPEYIFDYISLLYHNKEYSEAMEYLLDKECYLNNESKLVVNIKARLASKIHDLDKAIESFQTLSKKYGYEFATFNLALLLMAKGKLEEARSELNRIILENNKNFNYYSALVIRAGLINKLEKDEDKVIEEYQNAIKEFEEKYNEDSAYGFLMEYAAYCYLFLGNKEKHTYCKELAESYYQNIQK